jgi:predicted permease
MTLNVGRTPGPRGSPWTRSGKAASHDAAAESSAGQKETVHGIRAGVRGIPAMVPAPAKPGQGAGLRARGPAPHSGPQRQHGGGAMKPARPVTLGLHLCRALVRAFPYEFRNACEEELMRTTEDAIEPVWRRHGLPGLLRLLLDVALRVPAEHLLEVRRDIRYGLRTLAKSPGFTAVALLSLALGIGVATSAFSEMNGFVLRDVPAVRDPAGLVLFERTLSYPDYRRYRDRGDLFSSTLAYVAPVPFGVALGGHTERTWGHLVTPSYFGTLGVRPLLGRFFDPEDEQPGRRPSVVVSHSFWKNYLGSDPTAIGRALSVNGQPCTIVGVGPRDFQGASPMTSIADLWLPVSVPPSLAFELPEQALEQRQRAIFHVVGRLRPGVATARAEAELDAVARQIEREQGDPDRNREGRRICLLPGGKLMPMPKEGLPFITGFFTLLGGMILLIAAANVTNMTLARAMDRRKEIAIRLALGASRARLIRQLLTECMLIAAGAGVLGFLMATWLMRLASRMEFPVPVPLTFNLEPDGRVLAFTFALTVFTALAFGLLPALQATRTDLTPALKDGGAIPFRRFRRLSLRNLLVVSQVAGSLALLLITGFLVLGHRQIAAASQLGFDPRGVSLISLDPMRDGYSGERAALFLKKLLERVQGLPSVVSATLADSTPMETIGRPGAHFFTGPPAAMKLSNARRFQVGRDYFATLGIPLRQGRGFRAGDETGQALAVIVNERVVRNCWPGQNPLGQRIEIGTAGLPTFSFYGGRKIGDRPGLEGDPRSGVVVGVVGNTRDGVDAAAKELPPVIYLPLRPADMAKPATLGFTLVVRAQPGADAIGAVRREIAAMDSRITPFHARSLQRQIDAILSAVGGALWTYGCIGIFGLVLAAVGLAGVTAYSVAQRRREIGIRMALGARQIEVLGLVLKESAALVAVGSLAGFAAARAGMRLLGAFMTDVARISGMSLSNPVLFVGAPLLLAALAMACCLLPARRSMRIDPAVVLRQE